eukprot:680301_1
MGEELSFIKKGAVTETSSPKKIGPQMANAQPDGATSVLPLRVESSPSPTASPSILPGRETATTFIPYEMAVANRTSIQGLSLASFSKTGKLTPSPIPAKDTNGG